MASNKQACKYWIFGDCRNRNRCCFQHDDPVFFPPSTTNTLENIEKENAQGRILVMKFLTRFDHIIAFEDMPTNVRALQGLFPREVMKVDFSNIRNPQLICTLLQEVGKQLGFHFLGCSNSQLRERKAFLCRRSELEIDTQWREMGDFHSIPCSTKRLKRLGLLFSACTLVLELNPERVMDIPDVYSSSSKTLLTDGCGWISRSFLRLVKKRANTLFSVKGYLPCVIQIRYMGYKGVLALVVENELPPEKDVAFRPCMKKFDRAQNCQFGLVQASQPYSFGALNAQIVTLLVEMGIPPHVLMKKQDEYYDFLKRALKDEQLAFEFLAFRNKLELVDRLIADGLPSIDSELQAQIDEEKIKTTNRKHETRVRIVLLKSRLLFGIAEPQQMLLPHQVFVRVTINGTPHTLKGHVLITRNPCYHPGDIRLLQAVDVPRFEHLVDCVVFSTHANCDRSASADMSGGDLDGDKFLVVFDPDLVPARVFEPADYATHVFSAAPTRKSHSMVQSFAEYNNAQLSKINTCFLNWARHNGARSREALELSALFSKCVDGEQVVIPDRLITLPPTNTMPAQKFIVDELVERATANFETELTKETTNVNLLRAIVFDPDLVLPPSVSQFDVFVMIDRAHSKAVISDSLADEMFCTLDYASFSLVQKSKAVEWRHYFESMFVNALTQSELFSPEEVTRFNLVEKPSHSYWSWKRQFSSSLLGPSLHKRLEDCLTQHVRKLLVIRASERLTLALLFQQQFTVGTNVLAGTKLFATDHGKFENYTMLPAGYRLDLKDGLVQIYLGKTGNTFLWFRCERHHQRQAATKEEPVFALISVNLRVLGNNAQDIIPLVTKSKVTQMEMFVITSKDFAEVRHTLTGLSKCKEKIAL